MDISEIHVHCAKTNIASARMIKTNGGEFDSEVLDENETIMRFIIRNN